ncbi:UNVERIFIED_ORG: uncharacterized protein (DUF2141 family) [Arthrobacter globiformis]|nr:uncharacterized protein (DUF2141 family) [Arthrobacter globiformis]
MSAAPTSAAKAYTNEDLTAIVTGLKDGQGRALTVVPAAQLEQAWRRKPRLQRS